MSEGGRGPGPGPPPRRVIAAHSGGRATFTEVGVAPVLYEEGPFKTWALWGSDEAPRLGEPSPPYERTFVPPVGGVRATVTAILPGARSEIAAGMHATDTIDLVFVLEGLVHLIEADGDEIALEAGDFAVQVGTVHAWHNPGPETARIGVVLLGTPPAG